MNIIVVSLSCKGVMGLAAASFANTLSLHHEVCLIGGEEFPVNELVKKVVVKKVSVCGQGVTELVKLPSYQKLVSEIEGMRIDRIVFYSSHIHNLLLLYWAIKHNLKTVFVFHDPVERVKYGCLSKQNLYNLLINAHNHLMVKRVDMVFTTYQQSVQFVCEKYGVAFRKVASVPLIPLTELASGEITNLVSSTKKNDLVLYGRIDKYKDYATFFEAMKIVWEDNPDCSVLIVAQGNKKIISEHIKSYSRKVVLINDFLSEPEFEKLIASTRIAIFPYLGATGSHGPSVAFSLGIPVIATDVGCFKEYIESFGKGLCVPRKNPTALAKAIQAMLEEEIPSEKIQKNFLNGTLFAKKRLFEAIQKMDGFTEG